MLNKKSKIITLVPDVVKKPSGLKFDGTPNVPWRKFKERIDAYNSVPLKDWKSDQVLGHIFKRYSEVFGLNFSLSYSGAPSKCSEIYCVKRMMSMVDGDFPNPETVKSFIDWTFDSVIIPKKLQIESLAFFFSIKLIREFKAKYNKSKKITRSTELPKIYADMVNDLGIDDIITYGDLAFVSKAIALNPDNVSYKVYINLFEKLNLENFDLNIFDYLE
jgi:hypothetical protein